MEQDFIFSAICEEFGLLFGICLIAVCVNLFLEIVHIAHSCHDPFMKYAAFGLGIIYIVQLFLTIGGNSKFIPLTGVTLPLISYGGSSVLASLIMFSIVQGFYMNNDLYYEEDYDGYDSGEYAEDAGWDDYAPAPGMPRLHMNIAAAAFVGLFAAISGYLIHYVYFDSPQVINNSYNAKRQDIVAAKTIRGDILSADGQVLATTLSDTDERYYPFGEVFAHAVGYASHGRMGVEQEANMFLVSSNISLGSKLQNDLAETHGKYGCHYI